MDNANYQNSQQAEQQAHPVTEQQKPRLAYTAALLHLAFPVLGFGFFYRAENKKGHLCLKLIVISSIVAVLGSLQGKFGVVGRYISYVFMAVAGLLVLAIAIWNILEAIQLFSGEITEDKKGRTLHQDFILNIHTDK